MTVTPHAELRGYRGVWFFGRGNSVVVSGPSEWVARLEPLCLSTAAQELRSPAAAIRALGPAAGEMIGPSFQGWLPTARFCPVASAGVRRLAHDREVAISAVRSSCSGTEWEHGGIAVGASEVWASFEGAQVVALGQLRSHTGGAVDPCVITHSAYRGRGHASRVVSAMAAEALSGGRVVLYQTLLSNRPAMSLAMRLGFEHYATLLAVRLRPGAG